jgi:Ca-activated chloride channel family protein
MRFAEIGFMHLMWLLPLLGLLFIWSSRRKKKAMARFGSLPLVQKLVNSRSLEKLVWKKLLLILAAFFLILALARPQWGTRLEFVKRKGLDIMIVLDCSLSMETEDIKPSRLEKAKNQIENFMKNLRGDRVGLTAFAGDAFVQCPLTLDYSAASLFLDNMDTGIIPEPGTAIGKALERAAGAFNKKERKYKLMILITDGEDHEGDPVAVAKEVAREGIIIYTIGIGTRKGEPIPLKDEEGKLKSFKKDGKGEVVVSRLDEVALEKIALAGGGKYFRATTGELELEAIHRDIAGMEKKALSGRFFTQMEDRFQIPLFIAFLLLLVEGFLSNRIRASGAWEGRFK